jgi:hypothetical protein
VLFHFVSRKFSSKRLEHGFLENRGFLTIGVEKKEFSKTMSVGKKLLNMIFGFSIERRTFLKKN